MSVYNSEQLVSVHVYDKYPHIYFRYVPASWFNKAPYFTDDIGGRYTVEQVLNAGALIEDNKVYDKPEVRLTFSNDKRLIKTFNTLEEAKQYGREVTDKHIKPENRIYD